MMKYRGLWEFLGKMFKIMGKKFKKIIVKFMKFFSDDLHRYMVVKYRCEPEKNDEGKFGIFGHATYAIEMNFQQRNLPRGRMEDGNKNFRGKHNFYR